MVFYDVFFQKPDPPPASSELAKLQRLRKCRGLNRRLNALTDSGDWFAAANLMCNSEQRSISSVSAWQYALVVHCFIKANENVQTDFIDNLHERILAGGVPFRVELLHAMLTFYNRVGDPLNGLGILEYGREKGIELKLDTKGFIVLSNLAKNLNSRGLWRSALAITSKMGDNIEHVKKIDVIRAHSHALYGNWALGAEFFKNATHKGRDDTTSLSLLADLAFAGITSAKWEFSLRCISSCVPGNGQLKQEVVSKLWRVYVLTARFLRKEALWNQALALSKKYQCFLLPNQEKEMLHATTLKILMLCDQWKEAARYFIRDCQNVEFKSDDLRESAATVLIAAGNPEAARRIVERTRSMMRVQKAYIPVPDEARQRLHRLSPSYSLLADSDFRAHIESDEIPSPPGKLKVLDFQRPENRQPDVPLSYRWLPKAQFNRRQLDPKNGYRLNFTRKAFAETSPPPPTQFYDRSTGWTFWNQNFALPSCKKRKLQTAYCFSRTTNFQNIASYKRSWKRYRLLKNFLAQ